MSSPSTRIRPPDGSMRRLIIRRIVVLPQPDGPTRTQTSPSGTSRLRSSTATSPLAYCLRTDSSRITGVGRYHRALVPRSSERRTTRERPELVGVVVVDPRPPARDLLVPERAHAADRALGRFWHPDRGAVGRA